LARCFERGEAQDLDRLAPQGLLPFLAPELRSWRRPISAALRDMIRQIARENRSWDEERDRKRAAAEGRSARVAAHNPEVHAEVAGRVARWTSGRSAVGGLSQEWLIHLNATCAYPKPKPGRIDDGGRRGLVSLRCGRPSASAETLEHPDPMRDESGPRCNKKSKPSGRRASALRRTR
jgi:hypothetical protein